MTRYALYFTPAPDCAWWHAGCRWLGRDPVRNTALPQRPIAGVPPLLQAQLTADTRRYGLHATLKAPMRLVEGFDESHLLSMAQAFCRHQQPIQLQETRVRLLGDFLALRPAGPQREIGVLAMRCVAYFDTLRAAPTEAELIKRRHSTLTPHQEALLQRWGYPYAEDEFRFHLTLTDSLAGVDAEIVYAMRKSAEECFHAAAGAEPLLIDGLTICREERPGAPFSVWQRLCFEGNPGSASLPQPGRLFFCVGPSGADKLLLLQWLRDRLPAEAGVVFAKRRITRDVAPNDLQEPLSPDRFWQQAASGHFAMIWQANGLCYGIPRNIEAELLAGRDVIINGSREYIPQLLQLFPQAQIIWIETDARQHRKQLSGRRRDDGSAFPHRIERNPRLTAPVVDAKPILRVDNSNGIEAAGQQFLELIGHHDDARHCAAR